MESDDSVTVDPQHLALLLSQPKLVHLAIEYCHVNMQFEGCAMVFVSNFLSQELHYCTPSYSVSIKIKYTPQTLFLR